MSPERHQRAVEILETKAGLEDSADVERTREWGDAVAEADDEAAQAPAPSAIVDTELRGFAPRELSEAIIAENLAPAAGIALTMFPVRACRVCGCTDAAACLGGCWWVSSIDDICSACAPQAHFPGGAR